MIESHDSIEQEQKDIERESATRVLRYAENEMRKTAPVLLKILQARHELFKMPNSQLDKPEPVEEQLYEDDFYNDTFIVEDLRLRKNAKYHEETESYDPLPDDTPELALTKYRFRQAILEGAQKLGFVAPKPGKADDEISRHIHMVPGNLEPVPGRVDAIIVPGAKAVSNLMRIHDAVLNIESGKVDTDTIILAAGERPADPHELTDMTKLGYRASDNEFDEMIRAIEDMHGATFTDETETYPATYGTNIPDTEVRRGQLIIGDRVVTVLAVKGAYDRSRRDVLSGEPANRSITSETFRAAIPLIPKVSGKIVFDSHDTWGKGQEIIAQEIFGLEGHKDIIGAWAFKDDRVFINESGEVDILAAQAVIDELAKAHFNLVRLKVAALNTLQTLV